MTCPVNVSLSGGYPDVRTRRRGQEPVEPPQVRAISVGFSASTTGTPSAAHRYTGTSEVRPRRPRPAAAQSHLPACAGGSIVHIPGRADRYSRRANSPAVGLSAATTEVLHMARPPRPVDAQTPSPACAYRP